MKSFQRKVYSIVLVFVSLIINIPFVSFLINPHKCVKEFHLTYKKCSVFRLYLWTTILTRSFFLSSFFVHKNKKGLSPFFVFINHFIRQRKWCMFLLKKRNTSFHTTLLAWFIIFFSELSNRYRWGICGFHDYLLKKVNHLESLKRN